MYVGHLEEHGPSCVVELSNFNRNGRTWFSNSWQVETWWKLGPVGLADFLVGYVPKSQKALRYNLVWRTVIARFHRWRRLMSAADCLLAFTAANKKYRETANKSSRPVARLIPHGETWLTPIDASKVTWILFESSPFKLSDVPVYFLSQLGFEPWELSPLFAQKWFFCKKKHVLLTISIAPSSAPLFDS